MRRHVLAALLALTSASVACGGGDVGSNGLMTTDALKAVAPELDGWQRGSIEAQAMTTPEAATVMTTSYVRNGERLELEVSDTGGTSSMIESLAAMAGSSIDRPVSNGYFKGTTVAGQPAVESWNTQERLGELTVLVHKRYIIHVGGRGLPDAAPMRALVERLPIDRLPAGAR